MPLPPPGAHQPQKNTNGGFFTASIYSGALAPGLTAAPGAFAVAGDVMLFSGPGRLDSVTFFNNYIAVGYSGINQPLTFYDAAAPVSGGPLAASGHRPIAQIPAFIPSTVSGGINANSVTSGAAASFPVPVGSPIPFGVPFQSGLCVNTRSGVMGFTAVWTPENPTGQ